MNIRRLNDEGIRLMQNFLDSLTTSQPDPYPEHFLTGASTSESLPRQIPIERRRFRRRFDAAEYLYRLLPLTELPDFDRDPGLWAWLALFYFDQLCPTGSSGKRNPGESARWIPQLDNTWRYYRHLLLGPYLIYAAHSDEPTRAMCLLAQPLHAPGNIVGEIASRSQFVTSRAIVATATRMYSNNQGDIRPNVSGKRDQLGSARRLADVLMQLDRTFDLHAIDSSQLARLLPDEFQPLLRAPAT